jgi:PAS domain S-box-containing protein
MQTVFNDNILIIEDEEGISFLMSQYLSGLSGKIEIYSNGNEAIQYLKSNKPLLMLLDYSLGDMNASQLLHEIQSDNLTIPPFIVTTGVGDERIAVEMMKLGARDYLVKDPQFWENVPLVVKRVMREIETENLLHITQEALAVSEARYSTIIDNAFDVIFSLNNLGEISFVSQSVKNYGFTLPNLINEKFINVVYSFDKKYVEEAIDNIIHTGKEDKLEFRIEDKKGQIRIFEANVSAIRSSKGEILHIAGVMRDITERRLIERRIFETILETEERERQKLAGDLHDEVGPLLSSMNMYLSILSRKSDKLELKEIIDNLTKILKSAITSVREISNNLSPHVLINYGLASAINMFIESKRGLIDIAFENNIFEQRFSTNIEVVFYRVIKELINNTLKYAEANLINIKLGVSTGVLFLNYSDNGNGFDINDTLRKEHKGIGLLNIISRIKTINGEYHIQSQPQKGFTFELTVNITDD